MILPIQIEGEFIKRAEESNFLDDIDIKDALKGNKIIKIVKIPNKLINILVLERR